MFKTKEMTETTIRAPTRIRRNLTSLRSRSILGAHITSFVAGLEPPQVPFKLYSWPSKFSTSSSGFFKWSSLVGWTFTVLFSRKAGNLNILKTSWRWIALMALRIFASVGKKRTERMTSLRNRLPRYADNSTYFFVPVGSDRKTRSRLMLWANLGGLSSHFIWNSVLAFFFAAVSSCVILSPENVFITLSPQKYWISS